MASGRMRRVRAGRLRTNLSPSPVDMETHIGDIARAIQLAVAPVFLLTAIGTLITALNNRLGRAVDRRRILQERLPGGIAQPTPRSTAHARDDAIVEMRAELHRLARRARLIY